MRAAQSLDDRTGIWIEREERRNAGDPPPAVVWTPPLFYEDGVYDDPYAIESRTWRAGVKHAFARGDTVELWTARSSRAYAGLEVKAIPGALREDTLFRTGVDAVIPLSRAKAVAVDLAAGYGYVRNDSTDQFEQYRTQLMRIGIQLAF